MQISNFRNVLRDWVLVFHFEKAAKKQDITSEIVSTIAYESKKMWLRLRARITVNVRSEYPKHPTILNELYNEKLLKSNKTYHVMDLT